jgi:hypothetical protein
MTCTTIIHFQILKVASYKIGLLPPISYLPCKHKSHPVFMTALTLATNSLNDDEFSNVSMCGLTPTNSNYSLTNPLNYKRMARSIYIFTIIKNINYQLDNYEIIDRHNLSVHTILIIRTFNNLTF